MNAKRLHESMTLLAEAPWAIVPDALQALIATLQAYWSDATDGPQAARSPATARVAGQVAVLPVTGPIYPRGGWLADWLGLTTLDNFATTFRQAVVDPAIGGIVLDVDSPGGSVAGVDEMAAEIFRARGTKPIVAVANHMAASAAYWLATAADQLVVTPSSEVGSIGVFAVHEDLSQAFAQAGIKTTLISAGKYKVEGNPYEPLTDEARAAIQARVDEYYGMFVRAVARNRGVSSEQVRTGFGEGRVVGAKTAVSSGMADLVGTREDAIALAARAAKASGRTAAAETESRQRRARAAENW